MITQGRRLKIHAYLPEVVTHNKKQVTMYMMMMESPVDYDI